MNVTGEHAQVLATYAGEEADEWELDGTAAVTRNPYGSGEAYFVGCDLDVADLTKLVRAYLAASSQENADVLHTVRASADATFDFYLPRGKKTVELQGIEAGHPVPDGSGGKARLVHRAPQRRARGKAVKSEVEYR